MLRHTPQTAKIIIYRKIFYERCNGEMTDRRIYKYRPAELASCFLGVFMLALMIRNSELAIGYVKDGLSVCATTLIPALFPFMVISDLFVRSGSADTLGSLLAAPMRALFGVSGAGAVAIVLGVLCGFPIGARCAVSLFDAGRITKDECERLIAISSSPSSAFLISAVGVSLFGSRALGRALYVATLAASLIIGVTLNIISKRKRKKEPAEAVSERSCVTQKRVFATASVSESIASSADAMLKICAFVVFFTAFVGTLSTAFDAWEMPELARAMICSVFELTGGVREAATLCPTSLGATVAAFAAGWSGISVHLQIASICGGRDISLRPYILSKLASGALTAAMIASYMRLSPPELKGDAATALIIPKGAHIITAAFVIICIVIVLKRIKNRHLERKI